MEQIANVELDLWGLLAGNGGFFGFRWKIGFDGIKLVNGPSQAVACFRVPFSMFYVEHSRRLPLMRIISRHFRRVSRTPMFHVEHKAEREASPCFHPPYRSALALPPPQQCRLAAPHSNCPPVPRGTPVRNAEPCFTPAFAQNFRCKGNWLLQSKFAPR